MEERIEDALLDLETGPALHVPCMWQRFYMSTPLLMGMQRVALILTEDELERLVLMIDFLEVATGLDPAEKRLQAILRLRSARPGFS